MMPNTKYELSPEELKQKEKINSFFKQYLLWGSIAISIYLGGKFVASQRPPEEVKQEFTTYEQRINSLKKTNKNLAADYKQAQKENTVLTKRQSELEKTLEELKQ